jgi:hypothetical protein
VVKALKFGTRSYRLPFAIVRLDVELTLLAPRDWEIEWSERK